MHKFKYKVILALFSINTLSGIVIGSGNSLSSIKIDGSGNILTAGSSTINNQNQILLARYLPTTGALDTTFGTSGIVNSTIGSNANATVVAIQSDGKILVGGYAAVSGLTVPFVARYSSVGVLDNTFGSGGIKTFSVTEGGVINALALQSNGKIVAVGSVIISGLSQMFVARLNDSDGSFDTTFAGTGTINQQVGLNAAATSVAINTTTGTILLAGLSGTSYALVRYTSAGSLDSSFGTGGISTFSPGASAAINAITLDASSNILVAGYVDNSFAISKFTSAGAIDTTFATSGTRLVTLNSNQIAFSIAVQSDNKIVASGYTGNLALVVRLTTGGALDSGFNGSGIQLFSASGALQFQGVSVLSNQKIVCAGYACSSVLLTCFNTNGSLNTSFGVNGAVINPQGDDSCSTVSNNNYVYAYDDTPQPVGTPSSFQPITFKTDMQINGWIHSSGTAPYTCIQGGKYLIQYDVIGRRTSGSTSTLSARGSVSGTEIEGSQSCITMVTSNQNLELTRSFIVDISAGQVFQLEFTGSTNGIQLAPDTGNGTKRPSVTLTITRIG